MQPCDAEHAQAQGLEPMTPTVDLNQAHERITHKGLAAASRRSGIRLRRLTISPNDCGGKPGLCASQCKSQAAQAGPSIIAGCGFVTTRLRVLLKRWTSLRAHAVVNDATLAARGRPRDAEAAIGGGTDALGKALEGMDFRVSPAKGHVVSSDRRRASGSSSSAGFGIPAAPVGEEPRR